MKSYWSKLNEALNQPETQAMDTPIVESDKLVAAWQALSDADKTSEMKLFVKANLDSFYQSTLKYYPDLKQLLPAGFFDDGRAVTPLSYDISLFTTPVHKIAHQIQKVKASGQDHKPFVVLLNTGSYSPIHQGHLLMMEEARKALSQHYEVLGGYFSPSHDNYVSGKYEGTAKLHSDARLSLCEEVVSQSEWLMVDCWEARYNECSINFTDVIEHLQAYLKHHFMENIQVAYVFGSDNAGFSWAFVEKGIGVCFERPGYELQFNTVRDDEKLQNTRHFFISHQGNVFSSKAIREGNQEFLPERIRHRYYEYKHGFSGVHTPLYLFRDDRHFAISNFPELLTNLNNIQFYEALERLYQKTVNALIQAFPFMEVLSLDVQNQNTLLNTIKEPLINLDGCTYHPEQNTISLSRCFALADGQVFAPHLIARPGSPKIEQQISMIQPGHYILIDDDIASGRTIELVKELLPENVSIGECVALSRQIFHQHYDMSYQFHDIVDFRDFLIGAHDGGLVTELPDYSVARSPYVWPYINLVSRAKIPPVACRQFSMAIWQANLEFYQSCGSALLIEHMDSYFQNLALYLGFKSEMSMSSFCQWHLEKLKIY